MIFSYLGLILYHIYNVFFHFSSVQTIKSKKLIKNFSKSSSQKSKSLNFYLKF